MLLAVSGGLDSMVMLHLFRAAGLTFGIAHCNFQLRGAASDEDEAFVRSIAVLWRVPFFVKKFDTKKFAAEKGISIQMAARALRYEWFAETALAHHYVHIATAHNLNDAVETSLLNFVRGTGLPGLTGIRNRALQASLLRPLLFATRDRIRQFAETQGIVWREDSSNAEDYYARNYMRQHIIPEMQALNPNFLQTAGRNLERLAETADNLEFLLAQYLGSMPEDGRSWSIDKSKLQKLPAPRRALREMLKPLGFIEDQCRQLADNLDRVGFILGSAAGWEAHIDRHVLIVHRLTGNETGIVDPDSGRRSPAEAIIIHEGDLMVRLPDASSLFFMESDPSGPFPEDKQTILIDGDGLRFPLQLRHWREGDAFQPLGMEGRSQKLQDYFTNRKLPRREKDSVWLLCNGDGVLIWLLGMRQDERFKILPETSRAVKIVWR